MRLIPWDAFVAVGGGSSIDTAQAIDLLLTNPGGLMDYINAPVGQARTPVHPLRPLIAVPRRGDRLVGDGHPVPRAGELYGALVHQRAA